MARPLIVPDDNRWDYLRKWDLYLDKSEGKHLPSNWHITVVHDVFTISHQLMDFKKLIHYLSQRAVTTVEDSASLTNNSISDVDRIVQLINTPEKLGHLYCALLDSYEDNIGLNSHYALAVAVRRKVLDAIGLNSVLQDAKERDLQLVVKKLKKLEVDQLTACELCHNLHMNVDAATSDTNVQAICLRWLNEASQECSIADMVQGLLWTKGVGRCASDLLPLILSNLPEVRSFFFNLGEKWKRIARYLGYSEEDIGRIIVQYHTSPRQQIQHFLRVWAMPDCKERTHSILLELRVRADADFHLHSVGHSESLQETRFSIHTDDGTVLLNACRAKDWASAERLIQSQCYLEAKCEDGKSPFIYACINGNLNIVQLLYKYGADFSSVDKGGHYCLHYRETLTHETLIDFLILVFREKSISFDLPTMDSSYTPLMVACTIGDITWKSVELLLENGANPDGNPEAFSRPLIVSAAGGHIKLVEFLLQYKSSIDLQDNDGCTALLRACSAKKMNCIEPLLNHGANVNRGDHNGNTPLFQAVEYNSIEIVDKLTRNGALVNTRRIRGNPTVTGSGVEETPLAHACARGFQAMVKHLVEKGADVNFQCSGTMPPIGFALIAHQNHIVHYLINTRQLDKSIHGLNTAIITSVKVENHHGTNMLLEKLGGPDAALRQAQQNNMEQLIYCIQLHLQFVTTGGAQRRYEHFQDSGSVIASDNRREVDQVLYQFSEICLNIIQSDGDLNREGLLECARSEHAFHVADFLSRCFQNKNMNLATLRQDLLNGRNGSPSVATFLIKQGILTLEKFQIHVFSAFPDDSQQFCDKLVWVFHQIPGGENLPWDVMNTLDRLFTGQFVLNFHSASHDVDFVPDFQPHSLPQHTDSTALSSNGPEMTEHNARETQKQITNGQSKQPQQAAENDVQNVAIAYNSTVPQSGLGLNEAGQSQTLQSTSGRDTGIQPSRNKFASAAQSLESQSFQQRTVSVTEPLSLDTRQLSSNPIPDFHHTTRRSESLPSHKTDDQQESHLPKIPLSQPLKRLGAGSFGYVIEVNYRGRICAAKILKEATDMVTTNHRTLEDETRIFSKIQHHHIVPYYGLCVCMIENIPRVALLMERMRGSLHDYLINEKNLSIGAKLSILHRISDGLLCLHGHNIIHRDLTAKNVLLDNNNEVKISDFGNAHLMDQLDSTCHSSYQYLTANPGTFVYMPPEAGNGPESDQPLANNSIVPRCKYGKSLDIFSFGHLALFTMIQPVFPSPLLQIRNPNSQRGYRTEVERRERFFAVLKDCPDACLLLIKQCLEDESKDRPTTDGLCLRLKMLEDAVNSY